MAQRYDGASPARVRVKAHNRSSAWASVLGAMICGAIIAGVIGWRLSLQTVERQIAEKRSALKKLRLSGGVTPNQDAMDYLALRQT